MPGIDGVEATKRIRALPVAWAATVPIIALTANAVSGAREIFINAGMNDFIAKPIDAADLNRKLAQWLPAEKVSALRNKGEAPAVDTSPVIQNNAEVLDRVRGMRNIGGDAALYEQIVGSFKEDHYADYAEITGALGVGDFVRAHRIAHTLKSTAGLLGAGRLGEAAAAVEKALSEKTSAPPPELLQKLEAEFHDLRIALEPKESKDREAHTPEGKERIEDREKIAALIAALTPLLQSGNTGSLDLLGEIREVLYDTEKGKRLAKQIENFDFGSALETLAAIGQPE